MELFLLAFSGLCVLVGAAVLSRRTGIAAPLLLLGILFGYRPGTPQIELDPEWILVGVLPPLLYTSSVRLPMIDLSRNLQMITWLSVILVIISALATGFVVHALIPAIPMPLAIALGAVVSPTDAVAATAIGKRLGLPHRLMTVLEGESLLNDASALVVLRTAVAAIAGSFSFWSAAGAFAWAVVGAVVIGWAVGWVCTWVFARLGDPVLTTTVSFAVPFLAYFPAEHVHASGVIAVVVAGLVVGTMGPRFIAAADRATAGTNWATVNFILEHTVFLVMGMQLAHLLSAARDEGSPGRLWVTATAILVTLMVVRGLGLAITLIPTDPKRGDQMRERLQAGEERLAQFQEQERIDEDRAKAFHRRLERGHADLAFQEREPITARGGLVIAWAGMRGVVTLAAAQTIPISTDGVPTPYRATIILLAFIVAVASLILFGGTLPWLIRRMNFEQVSHQDQRAEFHALMGDLTDTVLAEIGPVREQVIDGKPVDPEIADQVSERFLVFLKPRVEGGPQMQPEVRDVSLQLQRRYLNAYRLALVEAGSVGAFSTDAMQQAQGILDAISERLDGVR